MSTHTSHKSAYNVKVHKAVIFDFTFVGKRNVIYFTTGTAGFPQPEFPKIIKQW